MENLFIIAIFIFIILGSFLLGFGIGRYRRVINENQGEGLVRRVLSRNFNSPDFHLFNNVTIPSADGSTQIDHILVSAKGIFVIETKHYTGWIFANEKSAYWTQIIYRVKNKFPNPLRQNFKHIKALEQLLDFIPKEQIHSVVVFTGKGKFKTEVPKNVFTLRGLIDHIHSIQENVITANRIQFCVGRIECTRFQISRQTDIEHIAYLNKKFGNTT